MKYQCSNCDSAHALFQRGCYQCRQPRSTWHMRGVRAGNYCMWFKAKRKDGYNGAAQQKNSAGQTV